MYEKIKNGFFSKLLSSCQKTTELVSLSMETELSRREKWIMKFHLWSCVACNRYLSQLKFMSKVFELREEKLNQKKSPALTKDAAERLKKALKSSKSLLIF